MNNIEEKLWDYIDGNCTEAEQTAIAGLIAQDEAYRLKYHELLKLNNEFSAMEVDEPPMAFTYNVMEEIRAQHAQQPLKATINKRFIMGIAAFFSVTILLLLGYILATINWSASGPADVPVHINFQMPNLGVYFTKPVIEGILFFYVISALVLFDSFLRRRNSTRQA